MMSIASQVFLVFYAIIYGAVFAVSDRWRPFFVRRYEWQGVRRAVLSLFFFGFFPVLYFLVVFQLLLTNERKDPVLLGVVIYSVAPLYAFLCIWAWIVVRWKDFFYCMEEQRLEPVRNSLDWLGSKAPSFSRYPFVVVVALFLIGPIISLFVCIGISPWGGGNNMEQANVAIMTLIGVVVGILGSYGGIILTNKLQAGRERKARLSELRLTVFREVNDLAAEFLNNYLKDSQYRPTDQFFRTLTVTTANIKVLFSRKAFDSFKEFEIMIPNLGPNGKGTIEAFIKARDEVLRSFFDEAVPAKLHS